MSLSISFVRFLFFLLSVIFMLAFTLANQPEATTWTYAWGAACGAMVGILLIGADSLFKRFNLRSFNRAILGLFIGYLMAIGLILIFNAIVQIAGLADHYLAKAVKICLFLFGTYLGVLMTLRASDEIYISVPFVKFTPKTPQIRDILLDLSALEDTRIIDFAGSGLLNKQLVLPRFLLKELNKLEEDPKEADAIKAKRTLDVVKKLELMPELHLRYQDTDFPEVNDIKSKVMHLARFLDATILTADINRIQSSQIEGVHVINMHALSNALKPLMPRGEFLKIKIQRYGKEDLQGVGYLEDGTMVVVNGGGDFIGETITARVLSVKHTSSGRMVFCNVAEVNGYAYDEAEF